MKQTITNKNQIPSLPPAWFGFLLVGAFVIFEFYGVFEQYINSYYQNADYSYSTYSDYFTLTLVMAIGIWIYWLFCIHRLHKILKILSNGSHDIKPGFAVIGHFIPIFNLYWIFHWPNEIAEFVNSKNNRAVIPKGIIGLTILIGFVISKIFSAAIGLSILFGVVAYFNKKFDKILVFSDSELIY